MIVKILQKSASFKGVNYNTSKIEKDKGELMRVANFGALQALDQLRPQDYINYLEAQSARSTRTKFPQFHAVISAKRKSYDKEQLAELAATWLKDMGYGDQPYLLIFHKDTENNHIHMVSSRVNKDGRKIPDNFEKIRSYQVLNRILGMDESKAAQAELEKALSYNFSNRAQFMMILETQGYKLTPSARDYKMSKFGKVLAEISCNKVDEKIDDYKKNKTRISQLRAIIEKYKLNYDPLIHPLYRDLPGGKGKKFIAHSSILAELLKEKFGIQILFHSKDDQSPYGYTVLDHAERTVFKGSGIMSLKEFVMPLQQHSNTEVIQPLREDNLGVDASSDPLIGPAETWDDTTIAAIVPVIQIDITDDVDDEAIHGRKRMKMQKKK